MPIRTPWLCAALGLALAGCAVPGLPDLPTADVVLLGEQHDDAAHHRREHEVVQRLAARGRLAALALEMAEQGSSTAGLPPDADEARVRAALHWREAAWPWAPYAPAILAAVRAGVPVLGANLPAAQMRGAMADAALDQLLDPAARAAQREAIRLGHCDLLPASQLGPMVRVQLARDRAMARTLAAAAVPGKTVVLLAGAGHVEPAVGVPRHLPSALRVQPVALPPSPQDSDTDHCEALRRQLGAQPGR